MIHAILHLNIRVAPAALEECRDFYCGVLGLHVGSRPPFVSVGYWLYAGNEPLVHLVAGETARSGSAPAPASSALQHVAFDCSDLEGTLANLRAKGVAYTVRRVPESEITQLNFTDPAGMGIELSFSSRADTISR